MIRTQRSTAFTFITKENWRRGYRISSRKEAYENAIKASNILFGKSTASDLKSLDEQTFLDVFDGVPQATVRFQIVEEGLDMIGALAAKTNFLGSNGEARRALKENAISVNKEKVKEDFAISKEDLIANKYVLLQRGKKDLLPLSSCIILILDTHFQMPLKHKRIVS